MKCFDTTIMLHTIYCPEWKLTIMASALLSNVLLLVLEVGQKSRFRFEDGTTLR